MTGIELYATIANDKRNGAESSAIDHSSTINDKLDTILRKAGYSQLAYKH